MGGIDFFITNKQGGLVKHLMTAICMLAIATGGFAATHVFWYKCITKNYSLTDNPGPNIQGEVVKHEGKIGSCSYYAGKSSYEDNFIFGSGLDDLQGRSGVLWVSDLNQMSGTCSKAVARAEFRDAWSGNALCNVGPIHIRAGVVDFSQNLRDAFGAATLPDNWVWTDGYQISETMGFKFGSPESGFNDSMRAQETIEFVAPEGIPENGDPLLEKQFVEVDVTDQVNWILAHSGKDNPLAKDLSDSASYAIAFIVTRGQGSTGKINTWASETCIKPKGNPYPWTKDGNTMHLVVTSDNLNPLPTSAEKSALPTLKGIALGSNFPNSFSTITNIPYSVESAKSGMLKVYNAQGRMVFTKSVTGKGMVQWNASDLASGIYTCRLIAGNKIVSKNMILMK